MSRSTLCCCTTMIGGLAALFLLSAESLICTAEAPALVSLTVVKLGDNVNLTCPALRDRDVFNWYKQSPGHVLHTVASRRFKEEIKQPTDTRLTLKKVDNQYFLTITNVSKEDEATYFCQTGKLYKSTFDGGTFLAVKDENPEKVSGRPGQQVTLQCSLVSKSKGNRVACPGVLLFRAGSGSGLSQPIYVHKNSGDNGTYHCALLSCGKILFGDGTYVNTRNCSKAGSALDRTVPVLGGLLACCVAAIVALIFFVMRNQRNVCKHCKGPTSVSDHRENDRSSLEVWNNVDGESGAVNYAVLDFPARKPKRGKEKREAPLECLYSAVEHR